MLSGVVQGFMQSEGGKQLGDILTKMNNHGAVDLVSSKCKENAEIRCQTLATKVSIVCYVFQSSIYSIIRLKTN